MNAFEFQTLNDLKIDRILRRILDNQNNHGKNPIYSRVQAFFMTKMSAALNFIAFGATYFILSIKAMGAALKRVRISRANSKIVFTYEQLVSNQMLHDVSFRFWPIFTASIKNL